MSIPFEGRRERPAAHQEKSEEVLGIEAEIAQLEAQKARIERRLAEAKARLNEAHRAPERVEHADFREPVPLPGEWAIEIPNEIPEGHGVPSRFKELVELMRKYEKSHIWTRDREALVEDFENMANGNLDVRSSSNPEMSLADIRRKHYPDWRPQDFRRLLKALPEKTRDEKADTFDQLAEAFKARILKAGQDSHAFFTADNVNRSLNAALMEFARNVPREWLNGNTAERFADAELYEDVSLDDLADEWFTADEDNREILFEGEPVARYQPGGDDYYGGRITAINERKLRSALEAFLRKTLTHAPRQAA